MATARDSKNPRQEISKEKLETLARYGFTDPYDPRFIWMAVFGNKMKGHRQRWPNIDFEELSSINPDVVGWIHMDGSPINYPIVKAHLDRSYYLRYNFSRELSCHGQIQLAFGCDGKIAQRQNTPLLAHTMSDWSMFRAIRNLCDQAYLDEHPTVEILTPEQHFVGRWFAAAQYHARDPWPEIPIRSRDAFEPWLAKVMAHNWLVTDADAPTPDCRILTCSMCAKSPSAYDMRALFAVLTS